MNQHELFARRSDHTREVCYACRDGLWRITGPVDADALGRLKSLQLDLEYKIKELERMGHWSRPGDTTASDVTTGTDQKTAPLTHGSAASSYTLNVATARKRRGQKTRRSNDVGT